MVVSIEWVIDCCLMPCGHFSAISWREQVTFRRDDDDGHFVLNQRAYIMLIFYIVLSHWNNNPRVILSLHSDTLSWFRNNQSLFLLLVKKQNMPIIFFGLTQTRARNHDLLHSKHWKILYCLKQLLYMYNVIIQEFW